MDGRKFSILLDVFSNLLKQPRTKTLDRGISTFLLTQFRSSNQHLVTNSFTSFNQLFANLGKSYWETLHTLSNQNNSLQISSCLFKVVLINRKDKHFRMASFVKSARFVISRAVCQRAVAPRWSAAPFSCSQTSAFVSVAVPKTLPVFSNVRVCFSSFYSSFIC